MCHRRREPRVVGTEAHDAADTDEPSIFALSKTLWLPLACKPWGVPQRPPDGGRKEEVGAEKIGVRNDEAPGPSLVQGLRSVSYG